MQIRRKVQVASAAVIANALLALFSMSPDLVFAGSCGPVTRCFYTPTCPTDGPTWCQQNAPSGCTYVSSTCSGSCLLNPVPPPVIGSVLTCNYH